VASMGLAAVGHHQVVGGLTAGHLFKASDVVGQNLHRLLHSRKQRSVTP
jgi:hypothetical protein